MNLVFINNHAVLMYVHVVVDTPTTYVATVSVLQVIDVYDFLMYAVCMSAHVVDTPDNDETMAPVV